MKRKFYQLQLTQDFVGNLEKITFQNVSRAAIIKALVSELAEMPLKDRAQWVADNVRLANEKKSIISILGVDK